MMSVIEVKASQYPEIEDRESEGVDVVVAKNDRGQELSVYYASSEEYIVEAGNQISHFNPEHFKKWREAVSRL